MDWKDVGHGWGITFLIVNEIARHTVVAMAMIAAIHFLGLFIEWISQLTRTSVVNIPLVWDFRLKQLLLTIDVVFILKLAYEGFLDIHRIYADARTKTSR